MGTKRQHKAPYIINYANNAHMLLELKQEDFTRLAQAVQKNVSGVILDDVGLVMTAEIRSIIKQKPAPKPKKEEGANPYGLSAEDMEWLAIQKSAWQNIESGEEYEQ